MGFKCGIVGLPNVGKSTLFNALTKAQVASANYPFCTIDPHVGTVAVPDTRLDALIEIVQPQKVIPTTLEFVDIAGLVAGASRGEGLGNQFLSHIREVDAIAHVVRCFMDDDIVHVNGKVNPLSDIETIQTELALADLAAVEKIIVRVERSAKSDKSLAPTVEVLEKTRQQLNQGLPIRLLALDAGEKALLKPFQLLTSSPMFYIANVDENGFANNPLLECVQSLAQKENTFVIPLCAKWEVEIAALNEMDQVDFLKELGLEESGLSRVIQVGYQLLNLQTFFTAGVKEVRAWTVKKQATAPEAAGCIHSDFQKGFIRAEVIAYEDFVHYKGEQGAKEAGKWRLEGKDYLVQDGDIMHFRFNV